MWWCAQSYSLLPLCLHCIWPWNDSFSLNVSFCGSLSVLLHRVRWCLDTHRSADLPEASQCHSQADVHLSLPQLCRLATRGQLQSWTCTALQRQQRGGADSWECTLHQSAIRRLPSKCCRRLTLKQMCRNVLNFFVVWYCAGTLRTGEDGFGNWGTDIPDSPHHRHSCVRFRQWEPEIWFPSWPGLLQWLTISGRHKNGINLIEKSLGHFLHAGRTKLSRSHI